MGREGDYNKQCWITAMRFICHQKQKRSKQLPIWQQKLVPHCQGGGHDPLPAHQSERQEKERERVTQSGVVTVKLRRRHWVISGRSINWATIYTVADRCCCRCCFCCCCCAKVTAATSAENRTEQTTQWWVGNGGRRNIIEWNIVYNLQRLV